MTRIVAYTYEADVHCPECTRKRFAAAYYGQWHPRDEHGLPDYAERDPQAMTDREGNPVHPVFSTDEVTRTHYTHCGTCLHPL